MMILTQTGRQRINSQVRVGANPNFFLCHCRDIIKSVFVSFQCTQCSCQQHEEALQTNGQSDDGEQTFVGRQRSSQRVSTRHRKSSFNGSSNSLCISIYISHLVLYGTYLI